MLSMKNSNIENLLLLPKNFQLTDVQGPYIDRLLDKSPVFSRLLVIEEKIQPLLRDMETEGLTISAAWFTEGLMLLRHQQGEYEQEIRSLVGTKDIFTNDYEPIKLFLQSNDLPFAKSIEDLSKYKNIHPIYPLFAKYKQKNMFINQWGEHLSECDQTIDGNIVLTGHWKSFSSYTGRITARNIALTSLPSLMRPYILPPPGFQIVSLDASNIELRFLAYYSQCTQIMQMFANSEDLHAYTGRFIIDTLEITGIPPLKARKLGKGFAYSVLYGAGDRTLKTSFQKQNVAVSLADVARLKDGFYSLFPEIKQFVMKQSSSPELLTIFGAVKPMAIFRPTQKRNFACQSSVAVLVKLLMIIANKHAKVIHVVHDEVWILAREPTETVAQIIEEFTKKIIRLLPGFPTKDLLDVEIIGGNINDKQKYS